MSKYIVYDCDMGLDDAWGLLLLLRSNMSPKVEVLAVTCSFGNTSVDYVCSNVIRMLEALDSLHVSFLCRVLCGVVEMQLICSIEKLVL